MSRRKTRILMASLILVGMLLAVAVWQWPQATRPLGRIADKWDDPEPPDSDEPGASDFPRPRNRMDRAIGPAPVAFSPDGKTLLTGTKLWDAHTGEERATLHVQGAVQAFVFSPDGRTLAFASWSRDFYGAPGSRNGPILKLWDLATCKERATLQGRAGEAGLAGQASSLAFSPDARTLASGSWGGTVTLLDVENARERVIQDRGLPVTAVAFSPDGALLNPSGS
jgi:WD40 repeat protein